MKTQEKIRRAVEEYIELHGYAPTFRELGAAVGTSSSATAKKYVSQLLAAGELETDHLSSARALRVPGMRWIDPGKYTAVVRRAAIAWRWQENRAALATGRMTQRH